MRWLTVVLVAGCTGGGEDLTLTPGDDDDDTTAECPGAEPYVDGLSQITTSGRTIRITSASPTPPDVGDNTWTIEVLDAGGAPEAGLPVEVVPWMPLHGHGLVPPTYGSTDAGDGTYSLETFDLIMPGLWQFTIDAAAGSDAPDEAVFLLCAEG